MKLKKLKMTNWDHTASISFDEAFEAFHFHIIDMPGYVLIPTYARQ